MKCMLPTKKSQAITHLIYAEQHHHCYAAFHQTTKPKSQGGLVYITMQDEHQHPTTLLDKDEMNHSLLEYSQIHFARAQGSMLHHLTPTTPTSV